MDAAIADRLAIRDVVETWASATDSGDWEAFRACWHEDGYMMATWFQGPKDEFIRVSREGAARGVSILHFTGGCRITLAGNRAIAQTRMTIMQRGEVHGVLCDAACTGRFYDFLEKRPGGYGGPEGHGGTSSPSQGEPEGHGEASSPSQGEPEGHGETSSPSQGEPEGHAEASSPSQGEPEGHGGMGPPQGGFGEMGPPQGGFGGMGPPEPGGSPGGSTPRGLAQQWGIVLRQPIYEKDRLDPVEPGASLRLDPELLARYPEGYRHLAYLQVQAGYPVKPDMPGLRGPQVERLYQRGAAWLAGQPVSP